MEITGLATTSGGIDDYDIIRYGKVLYLSEVLSAFEITYLATNTYKVVKVYKNESFRCKCSVGDVIKITGGIAGEYKNLTTNKTECYATITFSMADIKIVTEIEEDVIDKIEEIKCALSKEEGKKHKYTKLTEALNEFLRDPYLHDSSEENKIIDVMNELDRAESVLSDYNHSYHEEREIKEAIEHIVYANELLSDFRKKHT